MLARRGRGRGPGRGGGVVLGAVDPSVTAVAGVVLVGDVERVLGIVGAIDGEVGRLGPRAGWSGGRCCFLRRK